MAAACGCLSVRGLGVCRGVLWKGVDHTVMTPEQVMKLCGITAQVWQVYEALKESADDSGQRGRVYAGLSVPEQEELRIIREKTPDVALHINEIAPGFYVWDTSDDEWKRYPSGYCAFGDNYDKLTTWLRWDRATGVWKIKTGFIEDNYEPLKGGFEEALEIARNFFTG